MEGGGVGFNCVSSPKIRVNNVYFQKKNTPKEV